MMQTSPFPNKQNTQNKKKANENYICEFINCHGKALHSRVSTLITCCLWLYLFFCSHCVTPLHNGTVHSTAHTIILNSILSHFNFRRRILCITCKIGRLPRSNSCIATLSACIWPTFGRHHIVPSSNMTTLHFVRVNSASAVTAAAHLN